MDKDEYQAPRNQKSDETAEQSQRVPGPQAPETYKFEDWALI